MGLRADRMLAVGIKNYEISVASRNNCSFTGIQAEEFCGSGRNQFHKSVYAEAPLGNTARINQAHPVLDPRSAVGNFGEVPASHFFLLLETERAVIRRNHLQMVMF